MGIGLGITIDGVSRGIATLALKVPTKNAVIYNTTDMAMSYLVCVGMCRWAAKTSQYDQRTPEAHNEKFKWTIISVITGRVLGLAIGFFAAKATGFPVRPLEALALASASSVGAFAYGRLAPNR